MVHLSVFKCIDCGTFTYSIASTLKGQTALCRCCGKSLSTRCAENENDYLPKGYKAFSNTENAIQYLITAGCSREEFSNLIADPITEASSKVNKNKSSNFYVRFCEKCGGYFYYSGEVNVCPERGHLVDANVPVKYQATREIDAMRECARLNRLGDKNQSKKSDNNIVEEESSQSILFDGYYYTQDEILNFHQRVYRTWSIQKIFDFAQDGTLTFTRAYVAYLNGFPDGSDPKRIYKTRRRIIAELSDIPDLDQRFYFYLHRYNLLEGNAPLCWKIGNKCVCYESVDQFISCFIGKDIYNLTHEQMQPMINAQTKKYFFFPQNECFDEDGELNDLRFAALIMSHTNEQKLLFKALNYPSLTTFFKKIIVYDDKIGEKYDFIQTLLRHRFESDVEFLISKIFNCTPYDISEPDLSGLENIRVTDGDKLYLPEWGDFKKLIPYLSLCYYQCASNAGKLNVFQTDFGSSCDELIFSAKSIIEEAYKKPASKSCMRKFAVLRLVFLSGIVEAINGVPMELSSGQSLIGRIKHFFESELSNTEETEGSFENILSKVYILTLNTSERHYAPFVYDGVSRSLREHVFALSDNIDDLKTFWSSKEVQKFIDYVLNGNENCLSGQSREQIQESIDDIYKQCLDIETRLNKRLEEINSKYIKASRIAEFPSPERRNSETDEHTQPKPMGKRKTPPKTMPVVNSTNNDDSDW